MSEEPELELAPLSREDLDLLDDSEITHVDVPRWGRRVYLRTLGTDEHLELTEMVAALPPEKRVEAAYRLMSRMLCSADGVPLFADADAGRAWLGRKSPEALLPIQKAALRMMGWDGALEAAVKNG